VVRGGGGDRKVWLGHGIGCWRLCAPTVVQFCDGQLPSLGLGMLGL
jgi:hypothetical protein